MYRRLGISLILIVATLFGLLGLFSPGKVPPLFYLEESSQPEGFYLALPLKVHRADYVLSCYPPTAAAQVLRLMGPAGQGHCDGGQIAFVKHLVALPGDSVVIDTLGVRINGRLLPNSRPRRRTPSGKSVAYYPMARRLEENECLLLSLYNPNSLDSRYLGPVDCRGLWLVVPLARKARAWGDTIEKILSHDDAGSTRNLSTNLARDHHATDR